MKQIEKDVLEILNAQDQPRYSSWIVSRHWRKFGLFNGAEFSKEILGPMERAGLVAELFVKSRAMYQITSAGRIALMAPEEEKPLEIVPPRQISFQQWDGRMQWDTASERGCHPGIARVGLAC